MLGSPKVGLGGKCFDRDSEEPTAQIKQGVRQVVFRKLMAGVVLCSVPVLSFGVAQIATSGTAGAATETVCTGNGAGAVVTFATPGLSNEGTAAVSAKSTTKTGSAPLSCKAGTKPAKAGSLLASKIKSTSTTMCTGPTAPPNPPTPCPAGEFVYDSVAQLGASMSTLYQSDKVTSFSIGTTTYKTKNTGSPAVGTGSGPGNCPSGEVGFVLTGTLTAPASLAGKSSEVTACLLGDGNGSAGMNTTGNFSADVVAAAGGNNTIVIGTATLDAANSSVEFA
jgi:hypothetical protein